MQGKRKNLEILPVLGALAFALMLSGCGNYTPDRLGGGTAGGAATGATFGLIGGPIGVLIGGAVGGSLGALTATNTTPKQLNLGPPPWQRQQSDQAQTQPMTASQVGQQPYQPPVQQSYAQPQALQPQPNEVTPYHASNQQIQAQPLPPPH